MEELINFSGYPVDLVRFEDSWEEVRTFVRNEGLSGIELLTGGEYDTTVPKDLVRSVHLPGWLGWIRLWREPKTIPGDCDPAMQQYYFGGANPDDLLATFRQNLNKAASLDADYAVFHVTHIELDEFFTRNHRYSTKDVLSSAASFLNIACEVYPKGEPPVTLGLENLWWPGLTFSSQDEMDFFMEQLQFDNWHFVLDTGHLMNLLDVRNEREGIEKIISTVSCLSEETLERIRSVHFQCSTSGAYQKEHFFRDPPSGFSDLSYCDQISLLMPMVGELDQHRAFSDPTCREILEYIRPDYLVHEFVTRSRQELEEKIRSQKKALR